MKRLNKWMAYLFILIILISNCQWTYADDLWPAPPDIGAASAIIMEAETGAILYEKEIHAQNYPASITKILTTLIALEHSSMNETVTFSYDSVHKIEGSNIGVDVGEQLTMDQCLYAIMLASGNEVAYAVAEHVGGTMENFVTMMNEKAASLGCMNTNFTNSHGLPDENHYTSAYDMALIAKAAYENEAFRTIAATKTYTVPATNNTEETRPLTNHHKMLTNTKYHYDSCVGGKTGFTSAARNTLVTYAKKDGMTLICVVMRADAAYSQYVDTTALFNYGFQNFNKISISNETLGVQLESEGLYPIRHTPFTENTISASMDGTSNIVLTNHMTMDDVDITVSYDSVSENTIADINYTYNNHYLGKSSIRYVSNDTQDMGILPLEQENETHTVTKKVFMVNVKIIFFVIISILAAALLVVIIRYITNNFHFKIKLKRRRKRSSNRSSKLDNYEI